MYSNMMRPGVNRCTKLSKKAGVKRVSQRAVQLIAQGARGTLHAKALCPGDIIVAQGHNGKLVAAQSKLDNH